MPPLANEPTIPRSCIMRPTSAATASDVVPAPVWNDMPGFKYPDASMRRAVSAAMPRRTGSFVISVVPETMPDGSPMESTLTTKSTCS